MITQTILEQSPIQVRTKLNIAWLLGSHENWYFQVDKWLIDQRLTIDLSWVAMKRKYLKKNLFLSAAVISKINWAISMTLALYPAWELLWKWKTVGMRTYVRNYNCSHNRLVLFFVSRRQSRIFDRPIIIITDRFGRQQASKQASAASLLLLLVAPS